LRFHGSLKGSGGSFLDFRSTLFDSYDRFLVSCVSFLGSWLTFSSYNSRSSGVGLAEFVTEQAAEPLLNLASFFIY
jgi:hypothetical protein